MPCTDLKIEDAILPNDYGFAKCSVDWPWCYAYTKICDTEQLQELSGRNVAFWVNYSVKEYIQSVRITIEWNDGIMNHTTTYEKLSLMGTNETVIESGIPWESGTYNISSVSLKVI